MAQTQYQEMDHLRDAGRSELRAFFRTYLRMAREILAAIETDQWQKAWRLVKDRDRFCRLESRASEDETPTKPNVRNKGIPPSEVASLQGPLNEALELDRRSVELLEEKIGAVQTELRGLHTLRRWSLSRPVPERTTARLVDADG